MIVNVAFPQTLHFESKLQGSGSLIKSGHGVLELAPEVNNTFAGATQITAGSLHLLAGKPGPGAWQSALAIPGSLIIGSQDAASTPTVQLGYDQQISSNTIVVLKPNGRLGKEEESQPT